MCLCRQVIPSAVFAASICQAKPLCQFQKRLQRIRIAHGLPTDRFRKFDSLEDALYGHLQFLPVQCLRNFGTLKMPSGKYRGDNSVLIRSRIRLVNKSSNTTASRTTTNRSSFPGVSSPAATKSGCVDHQRSKDFREGFNDLVKFAGAHPHPAAIQR